MLYCDFNLLKAVVTSLEPLYFFVLFAKLNQKISTFNQNKKVNINANDKIK